MKLLLDTHTLLWWHEQNPRLSHSALTAISDPANTVFFSVVNLWEAQIKHAIRKMDLPDALPEIVRQQHNINGFGLLGVHASHVYQLDELGHHHRDPFDRLLIAQALHEGLTLVTRDGVFEDYGVPLLW